MEAGQHCINVSNAVCPWHGDSLVVDLACGVHLFTQLLLTFKDVNPCKCATYPTLAGFLLLQPSVVAWWKANCRSHLPWWQLELQSLCEIKNTHLQLLA